MEECSFKPKLYKNKKYNKFLKKAYNDDIYDRTTRWKEAVDQKVYELKQENATNKDAECTFAPDVSPNKKDYLKGYRKLKQSINKKAIDKYLERMIITRLREEEKQKQQYNAIGSGNHWKDRQTIPKPPKLSVPGHSKTPRNPCRPQTEEINKIMVNNPSMDLLRKHEAKRDEYIRFEERMTYEQALNLIHNTILSLG